MSKKITNPRYKGKGKKTARHFSGGGMLVGPSHENGGIQAVVDGVEPIEVEGGEFIINKQTVDAVGEEFLHKLNSTETTHHTGGFNQGQLPSPSQFKDGGKINRRSKMRGRRKMGHGGMGCNCGPGQTNCAKCGGNSNGYRRGGRTKPIQRKHTGGKIHNQMHRMGYHHGEPQVESRVNGSNRRKPFGGSSYRKGGRTKPVIKRKVNGATKYKLGGSPSGAYNSACTMHSGKYGCQSAGCKWNVQLDRCH